jgi:hypothetical protein
VFDFRGRIRSNFNYILDLIDNNGKKLLTRAEVQKAILTAPVDERHIKFPDLFNVAGELKLKALKLPSCYNSNNIATTEERISSLVCSGRVGWSTTSVI